MSHFHDTWGHAGRVAKVLLGFIIAYAVFSIYFLLWLLDIAPTLTSNDILGTDTMWIIFTIISFIVAILIAAFHLSVMMFKRNKEHEHVTHTG